MFSAFRMGPANGRGLCDIDALYFRVPQSRNKKLGIPEKAKLDRL